MEMRKVFGLLFLLVILVGCFIAAKSIDGGEDYYSTASIKCYFYPGDTLSTVVDLNGKRLTAIDFSGNFTTAEVTFLASADRNVLDYNPVIFEGDSLSLGTVNANEWHAVDQGKVASLEHNFRLESSIPQTKTTLVYFIVAWY